MYSMLGMFIFMVVLISLLLASLFMFDSMLRQIKANESIESISDFSEILKEFDDMLKTVRHQRTKEILECLIEMKDLDKVYEKVKTVDSKIMKTSAYENVKRETLRKIINEKINQISISRNRLEKFKALKDELKYCKKRFPEFREIFDAGLYAVSTNIDMYTE